MITFDSLLREMIAREALAEFPQPAYTCGQFSSYDRASTDPSDYETWFANADAGHFLRIEERDGRRERVLMDAQGPGAVVRLWSANPRGTLRIYLDDQPDPVIETPMADLLGGDGLFGGPPLSAKRSLGWNLYVPIPYASRCVITSDEGGFYYHVNYRTYEPATRVQPFTLDDLARHRATLDLVQRTLINSPEPAGQTATNTIHVHPGETQLLWRPRTGPGAITEFSIQLDPDADGDLESALRSTILLAEFDGQSAIEAPVGDFFGAAPGVNPYRSFYIEVHPDGRMICRYLMPYEREARLSLRNLGSAVVSGKSTIRTDRYDWSVRSMHFRANWRIEHPIPTRPFRDWNYITIDGQGILVADSLSVMNPVREWWGEGDEKIYVDGESFPSHFGTGTEDYYGYAWCSPQPFEAPLHNQPRCDGPGNYGYSSVNRFRALDAIPFRESLRFDMEVWHWVECEVAYAATVYWYGRPGARAHHEPITAEMVRTIPQPPPLPPPFRIEGALEGEELKVVKTSRGLVHAPQELWKKNTYSGDTHLWVQARNVGDFIELEVPLPDPERGLPDHPNRYEVFVYLTTSWDYGIIQLSINGNEVGDPIDTFNTEARDIGATGPISLGVHHLGESFILRLEVVGANPASQGARHFFGLDAVTLTPAH